MTDRWLWNWSTQSIKIFLFWKTQQMTNLKFDFVIPSNSTPKSSILSQFIGNFLELVVLLGHYCHFPMYCKPGHTHSGQLRKEILCIVQYILYSGWVTSAHQHIAAPPAGIWRGDETTDKLNLTRRDTSGSEVYPPHRAGENPLRDIPWSFSLTTVIGIYNWLSFTPRGREGFAQVQLSFLHLLSICGFYWEISQWSLVLQLSYPTRNLPNGKSSYLFNIPVMLLCELQNQNIVWISNTSNAKVEQES